MTIISQALHHRHPKTGVKTAGQGTVLCLDNGKGVSFRQLSHLKGITKGMVEKHLGHKNAKTENCPLSFMLDMTIIGALISFLR